MENKELEQQYLQQAEEHFLSQQSGDAAFITGVQVGLDLREEEVNALKEQIANGI